MVQLLLTKLLKEVGAILVGVKQKVKIGTICERVRQFDEETLVELKVSGELSEQLMTAVKELEEDRTEIVVIGGRFEPES